MLGSTLFGDDGSYDTLSYRDCFFGVQIDLANLTASGGDAEGDVFLGFEAVEGSQDSDQVWGASGANRLTGFAGDDFLGGRAGVDTLLGGDGNDTLGGGAGADILNGGEGMDVAWYLDWQAAIVVDLLSPNLNTGDAVGDIYVSIEGIVGTNFSDTLSGDDAANEIFGGVFELAAGADILFGRGGNDILHGDGGNDRLDGGAGADTLDGGTGSDVYIVDSATDVIIEAANDGNADRVMARTSYTLAADDSIELLTTVSSSATTAINLTGNAFHQEITGNAGANTLRDGGGAGDTMKGLGGNDLYMVYSASTTIAEGVSQGVADRVMAAVDFSLGAGVAVEIMTTNGASGTTGIDLTGNELAQQITGNAGGNRLDGGAGADRLQGLGGKDFFVFSSALGGGNVDTITDFRSVDDTISLENAVFTALATTGGLAPDAFRANTTGLAADATDRIIYETDTGKLFYDANGSTSGGGVHFATLTGTPAISVADFVVT